MAILFNCPYCTAAIRVGDEAAGKIGKCPQCETKLRVPALPKPPETAVPVTQSAASAPPADVAGGEPPLFPGPPADVETIPETWPGVPAPSAPQTELPSPVPPPDGFPVFAPQPIGAPSTMSYAQRVRQRRGEGWAKVLIPLLFGGILVGVGFAYWWAQRPTMTGELAGERLPHETVLRASIAASLFEAAPEAYRAAVDGLREGPQLVSSDYMHVNFTAGTAAVQIELQPGPEADLVRVNMRANELLREFYAEHIAELDSDRQRQFESAAREYMEAWHDSAGSGMLYGNTSRYRDSVGLGALLRGLGYHSAAIVDKVVYPCVHEDDDLNLYFIVPRGTTEFELTERERFAGVSVFQSEYRFTVKVAAAAPAEPPAPTGAEGTESSDGADSPDTAERPAEGEAEGTKSPEPTHSAPETSGKENLDR